MGGPVGLRKGARLRAGAPGFAESAGRSREVCLESRLQSATSTEINRPKGRDRRPTSRFLTAQLHDGSGRGPTNGHKRYDSIFVAAG